MGCWVFISLLLLVKNVNAFMMIQPGRIVTIPGQIGALQMSLNDKIDDSEDSRRRRQLLLSSLLAGGTAALTPPATADTTTTIVSTDATINGDVAIVKAPLDERDYEYLVLENGLRVVLCHDESETRAACAMAVHVGATSDRTVDGLAHFCEHMLFLGTKKYPTEDEFELYLQNHGGSSNAFTDAENTVYYFDVLVADQSSTLSEAVDRFANFFISPLFNEDAVQREVNAIDSEHGKNIQNDAFRLYQLDKYRVNKEHPYSRFFTGTKTTLLQNGPTYLRNQLLDFHSTYYSANQMVLAIVAPQPLKDLKRIVEDSCKDIPNNNRSPPEFAWNQKILPYDKSSSSKIPAQGWQLTVVPVKDLRQVSISFPLVFDSLEKKVQEMLIKPEFYVTHILGHEGPQSLLSYLKKKEWANELEASISTELSDFTTLEITVELTTRGLNEVNSVIASVFSALQILAKKPIPTYIYQEVLQLSELDWRFLTKGSATPYVQSLVKSIYEGYTPSLTIAGPRRLALNSDKPIESSPKTTFESGQQLKQTMDAVQKLISQLTVDNAVVTLVSQDFADKCKEVDPFYGTQYSVEKVPFSTMMSWKFPPSLPVNYPPPNLFIPSEAGLSVKFPKQVKQYTVSLEDRWKQIASIQAPTVIREDERWTVYYKKDERFGQPKAYVIFQLLNGDIYSSPKAAVLAQLYQLCFADQLEEYAYDARLAGISYDVNVLPRGVRCTFGGYNEKLLDFSTYILNKLSSPSVLPQTDQEWTRYLDNYKRALKAFDVSQPYSHAIYYSSLIFQPLAFQYTNAQLRNALTEISRNDLTEYVRTLWSSGKGQALIQGNLYEEEAQQFVNVIDNTLKFRTDNVVLPPTYRALPLPISSSTPSKLMLEESNPSNENAAVQFTLQCMDTSEESHVLMELISSILSEPFYEELRTKQQLGYIVSSGVKAVSNTRILSFIVQSNQYNVDYLTTCITNFIETVPSKYLTTLTKEKVDSLVKSSILRRTEPDKNLAIEASRNWNEIATGRLQFDRLATEAKAAYSVSKSDILKFWKQITVQESRMLLTQNVPLQGAASSSLPPKSQGYSKTDGANSQILLGINDIDQFRKDRE